jgi:hypothetical protein
VLRGFGPTHVDFTVQRQFPLTEKVRLNFRSEFFYISNHPNFGFPNNNLTSSLFGLSTQTRASSRSPNGGFNPCTRSAARLILASDRYFPRKAQGKSRL